MITITTKTSSPLSKISSVLTLEKVNFSRNNYKLVEKEFVWGYAIKYFLLFFWAIPWSIVMGFILEFSMVYWGFMQFYYVILFLFFLTTRDYHTLSLTYVTAGLYIIYTLPTRNIRSTYIEYHQLVAFAIANFLIAIFFFMNKQLKVYREVSNKIKTKPSSKAFRNAIFRHLITCFIVSIIIAFLLCIYVFVASKPVPASKEYEISFTNKNFEKAVRTQLNCDDNKKIMRSDLDNIQGIIVNNKSITFSNKYEYDYSKWSENNLLFNFEALETIVGQPINFETELTNIKDLKHFRKLKFLQIQVNGKLVLYNIDDLQCLEELETLKINFNKHDTNIDTLGNIKSLKYLSFEGSKTNNVNFVKTLDNLTTLRLIDTTELSDTSALPLCKSLKHLAMDNCEVSDTSDISELTTLTYLSLNKNTITDLNFVENMANLEFLDVHCNMISDIKALANNKNLKYLLLLKNNNITDISSLYDLTNLKCIWLEDDKKNDTKKIKSKNVQIYTGI